MLQTSWDRVTSWGRVTSYSSNKIHQTWWTNFSRSLYGRHDGRGRRRLRRLFPFSQTRVIKRYIGRSKQCNLGKDPKISYCLYPWTLPPFWRKTWSWKKIFFSSLFLPLVTSGVLLSRTDFWFKTARQIDNRQIRPAFLPAGCNCDKKTLLNGRGGEMIEEERAKQTRLDPGNLLGCSKMALPDGRSYAGILSCWKHDLCH